MTGATTFVQVSLEHDDRHLTVVGRGCGGSVTPLEVSNLWRYHTPLHFFHLLVDLQGIVTTVAGDGLEGSDDGDALEASFSFPGGIALFYDASEGRVGGAGKGPVVGVCRHGRYALLGWSAQYRMNKIMPRSQTLSMNGPMSSGLVLYVADTNNHRLRKISGDVAIGAGTVSCFAGR